MISDYHKRKQERTKRYYANQYKNKLVECIACSGSGIYDHNGSPPCDACDGTGKVRERDYLYF